MERRRAILAVLAMLAAWAAHAIEPRAGVQVKQILKTTTTWNGAPIRYPQGAAEITSLIIEVAPGADTGWHQHPVPSFGMVLEGTLEVTLASGEKRRIEAGEALAEVIDTTHNGRNVGSGPVKLLVFYAGAVGKPLTVPQPQAAKDK